MATLTQSKLDGAEQSIEALKTLIQKDEDNSQKLAQEVKHHEDNLNYLNAQVNIVDESIHRLQGELKECYSSSTAKGDNSVSVVNTGKQLNDQVIQLYETAAGVICEMKERHGSMLSTLKCTKDVLGIVASLGKVADENLSRILSEYLGLDTMLAIVCKTIDGVEALESYEEDGSVDRNAGFHGIAPTIGRKLSGRFLVYCLQNMRPFSGEILPNDPQKRLALMNPKLPNGKFPPGFLGFAVNMIYLDPELSSFVTVDGRGLRETLFFSLFTRLQVFNTRSDMMNALPFISDGAISLDGGMVKGSSLFCLGERNDISIRFPITHGVPNPFGEATEIEQKIKLLEWKKQMLFSDIQREETLISNVKCVLKAKSDGYRKLFNDENLNKVFKKHFSQATSPSNAMSKIKEVGSSVMWDKETTIIFCNLCLREIELGNRPNTFFNKEGWKNLVTKFKKITGRNYDRTKFKNKWDQLRKDWKLWKELKRGFIGMGWDPVKRTIDASEAWWTEKLEAVPAARKFKFSGIDPVLEEKLDIMFSAVVAIETHAFTPSEHGFTDIPDDLEAKRLGDSGEGPSLNQRELESTCQSKRPRVEKRKKRAAFVKKSLKEQLESCKIQAGTSRDNSIGDFLRVLDTYPEVKLDKPLYLNSLKLLEDLTRRQIFIQMDPELRVDYLRFFMDK